MNGAEITLRLHPASGWSWLQAALAFLGIVLLLPVMGIVAIAVKVTSRGPVLYRGIRVGKDQRLYTMYKFRTLRTDAEQKIGARLLRDGDDFYTPVGKFLKKAKLDELPQLFNVLRGEMLLVGPRPIRPIFVKDLARKISGYGERFSVPPGLTGLAQLRGGYYTDPRNKLRYERIYIRNQGLVFDLKIILLTLLKLFARWFTVGFALLIVFLFLSFFPAELYPKLYIQISGIRINVIHLALLAALFRGLVRLLPRSHVYLYRSTFNVPAIAFVLYCAFTALWAVDPQAALRGTTYYFVTGFAITFILLNGSISQSGVRAAVRVVALSSALISLGSLFRLVAVADASLNGGSASFQGTDALFKPELLASYLVLGLPLLFCELSFAKTQKQRDFWLICTTVASLGVVMTQSRVGMLALAVTGTIFFARESKFLAMIVPGCIGMFFVGLGLFNGSPWSSAAWYIKHNWWTVNELLGAVSWKELLIGLGTRNLKYLDVPLTPENLMHNMHIILIVENGIIGWLLMLWILGAVLAELYRGAMQVSNQQNQTVLWAILSSVVGFLISMNSVNLLYLLRIQVFFWALVGVGLALTLRLGNSHRGFIRVWRAVE